MLCAYKTVLTARLIDAKILVLLKQGKAFFHVGCTGHEVAQVATAAAMRPGHDWAYPYYRDLAFALKYGYTIDDTIREAMHRQGGPGSNGFSMMGHYGKAELSIIAQSSLTGTQYQQAEVTAMGAVREKTDEVVYV